MRLYVAGPMTGYPNWNHPAFHVAAFRLRAAGFTVANPADHGPGETDWFVCVRRGLRELLDVEGVATLPGWEQSRGAALEVHVACALNMPVRTVEEWIVLPGRS